MKQLLKRKKGKAMPEISTASLPDIIFMLLFFFMVVTVMRTNDAKLPLELPATEENEKVKQVDNEFNIQLSSETEVVAVNNILLNIDELENHLTQATAHIHKADRMSIPVYLRVDRKSSMGLVYKVKVALRKTGLRKVNYIVKNKSLS